MYLFIGAVGVYGNDRTTSLVALFTDTDISKVIDTVIISKVNTFVVEHQYYSDSRDRRTPLLWSPIQEFFKEIILGIPQYT